MQGQDFNKWPNGFWAIYCSRSRWLFGIWGEVRSMDLAFFSDAVQWVNTFIELFTTGCWWHPVYMTVKGHLSDGFLWATDFWSSISRFKSWCILLNFRGSISLHAKFNQMPTGYWYCLVCSQKHLVTLKHRKLDWKAVDLIQPESLYVKLNIQPNIFRLDIFS